MIIEADFCREYRVDDLCAWCWAHTWGQFMDRLCGLSSRSRFMELLAARKAPGSGGAPQGITKAQSAQAPSLVGQYRELFAGRKAHSARNRRSKRS